MGQYALARHQYALAAHMYEEAIQVAPNDTAALFALAKSYARWLHIFTASFDLVT